MSEVETKDISSRIQRGLRRTFKKLVKDKKSTNSELAFVEHDEVVKVNANDL